MARDLLEETFATISDCGLFRYQLGRKWGPGPIACYIMLNPSTANAEVDDRTIGRCRSFAWREGCGGFVVVNLFAFRATDPKAMKAAADPVGPENDANIRDAIRCATATGGPVIAAWGKDGAYRGRDAAVRASLGREVQCLGKTKDGHPKHPLYVKGDTPLIPLVSASEVQND